MAGKLSVSPVLPIPDSGILLPLPVSPIRRFHVLSLPFPVSLHHRFLLLCQSFGQFNQIGGPNAGRIGGWVAMGADSG